VDNSKKEFTGNTNNRQYNAYSIIVRKANPGNNTKGKQCRDCRDARLCVYAKRP